ncbi:GHKL domain-containing protein [Paenibacillus sp. P96]|uniref:GHKL domain-containing protein n=1 Tax=Paenibacillus zeirhizosphaerae TaxID=2987519 RepID=A0ABT9FVU9_9BACL|nr:GHKL domain-containing protein [Paenibacillus sp. P96]MDP4098857.1 GHKL domain-containing protein [Paenibacillus sp. P96]
MMNYGLLLLNLVVSLVMCLQVNYYFNSVFSKSNKKENSIIYLLIFWLLDFLYLCVELPAALSSLLALFVIFSLAHSFHVELKLKIIFSTLYAVLLTLVNFISSYILYDVETFNLGSLHDMNNGQLLFSKIMLLSCIFMFPVVQIIRLIAKRRSFPIHARYYLLFLIVPVVSIYQGNVLSLYSEKNMYYFVSIFGLLLLNVFIVYIFDNIVEKFQLIHQNTQLQNQMDYQDANYEKTVHSFKNIKRIIHDTNQQFLYIEECIKRNELEQAREHIKVTLNKIEDAYHRVNTGNLVIDALVTNTLNIGQANGIKIDTRLSLYDQEMPIERYDLCVVLGNMLDNALEASKKVRIADDRYILIKIHSNESALFLHILNHVEHETTALRSQKSNPEYHGLGLTNISRICEKYGGHMTIESNNKVVNNMVVLPF